MKNAYVEALKEVGRWIICLIIGWVIAETLKQINAIQEFQRIKLWVFVYEIPVRLMIQTLLTLAGRAVDKYSHEREKLGLSTLIKLPF